MNDQQDRRSERRIQQQATIFVEIQSGSADGREDANVVLCNSIDLSANGLQLALDQSVPVGSILRLCVDQGPAFTPMYLVGEVRWVRQQGVEYFIGFSLYDAENSQINDWKAYIESRQQ